MQKILNITILDYENLGNRLQNFAVCKSLEKYNVITDEAKKSKDYIKYISKRIIIKLIKRSFLVKVFNKNKTRFFLFWKFSCNIPRTILWQNNSREKKVRYYIYGSDQIWNPEFGPSYCINPLTNKEKNIALCASIGTDCIPETRKEEYISGLKKFKYISVREDKAAEIVEDLIGIKPEVLIDPTLALDREEWNKVESIPCIGNRNEWSNKKYILLYFLGDLNSSRISEIEKLASQNEAEIIDVTRDEIATYVGPAEFIWLIHHALMILTDSYHGSVFSFIFDKTFYVLDREDTEIKMSMNSRFDTLFRKLDLYDRKNNNISSFTNDHDYTESYKKLEYEKEKYYKYIESCLD